MNLSESLVFLLDTKCQMLYADNMIIEVIPEKRTSPDKDTFSYLVPEKLQSQFKVGSIVDISFGKKAIRGIVATLSRHPERPKGVEGSLDSSPSVQNDKVSYKLKEIKSINSNILIPEKYLEIAKWISDYYLCSLGEAVSLFLPPIISHPRNSVASSQLSVVSKGIVLTTEQEAIFVKLKDKLIYCSSLSRTNKKDSSRSPSALSNNKQSTINSKPALILGVTGSGKTEIYLKLAAETLKQNKQVIVLVPEIMLTPQTVEKFEQVFPDQICLLHSGLSKGERYLSYKQFYDGEKQIIIGPRSALLVPSENIGLIIIDEEQEDTYKQEKDPRYHAVDLAEKIAEKFDALLVLGTATPRTETFFKCHPEFITRSNSTKFKALKDCSCLISGSQKSKGMPKQVRHDSIKDYDLFELKSRYRRLILPPAKIVDLKDEIKKDNFSPISIELQNNIAKVLNNKRHVILFLNRRGMATFVSCRECGEVIMCPNCNIPMVYHVNFNSHILNCHHCDKKIPVPALCPVCRSPKIKFFGAGVDKIETEIFRLFPKARIKKIDSKVLQNKGEYMKLYEDLKSGKIDILIGTQILAKGLDIGTVDLVGVISADTGLHMPHFRASEKVFSLITQVSGRSGRKDNAGKTVIQTYWPDASAIKFAAQHNYKDFYKNEILEREKFNYPPFCHLVRVISEDKNQTKAKNDLDKIAKQLEQNNLQFIGPGPCFLNKINGKFRYHIIIKTNNLPDSKISEIFKTNPYLVWDSDPVDLL